MSRCASASSSGFPENSGLKFNQFKCTTCCCSSFCGCGWGCSWGCGWVVAGLRGDLVWKHLLHDLPSLFHIKFILSFIYSYFTLSFYFGYLFAFSGFATLDLLLLVLLPILTLNFTQLICLNSDLIPDMIINFKNFPIFEFQFIPDG